MNIRNRLTWLFIGLVALILSISSFAAYYFSASHREEDFYFRLINKAINTAKLLIEVEEVDANLLALIEQDNPTSLPNERIIIYNYQNTILYTSDPEGMIPVNAALLDEIRLKNEVRFTYKDYEVVGILYADRYDRFVVIAAAKDTFGWRKIRVLRNILSVTFVSSILLMAIAGWIYSGRALKPISRVIDQVNRISETSLNLRVDEGNRHDEIARLAMTFNQMLERLEKAFVGQRNFISNASHELRTPLTAITGKIEVMLMQPRTGDQYQEALHALLRDVRNLNLLSNRLLMLAQTTAEGARIVSAPVRIDELMWQAKDDLQRTSRDYVVSIDFDLALDDESLTIQGDEQLLKAAMINLMDNGCKYSSDKSVQVSVRQVERELLLTFSDNGVGIPESEQPHIFEPFYRAKNAITVSGHGIGLSIVSKIIQLHQGRITFESESGKGTKFQVYLPL